MYSVPFHLLEEESEESSRKLITSVQHPKILLVDSLLHFSSHATYINQKVRDGNKVLKALARTTWVINKETLIAIYNLTGRSVLYYAAPVSDTQWRGLQTAQNKALRIATPCVTMTYMNRHHVEAKQFYKRTNVTVKKITNFFTSMLKYVQIVLIQMF